VDEKAILEELLARQQGKFDLSKVCFDKQIAFILDESKLKTAVCGRRSGKTHADAAYLLYTALNRPASTSLYITLTRSNAKKIVWPTLLELNYIYKLGGVVNESDLAITFGNSSRIFLSGASDATEVEKFRGLGLALCLLDEGQSFKDYIRNLIEDVISKCLYDFDGTFAVTGTPGPVAIGYFHECSQSDAYSHHKWTMFDNPYIKVKSGKTPQQLLDQDLHRKGVTLMDPSIRREVFAEWVTDSDALVFKYDKKVNDFTDLPSVNEFVIGVDMGTDDADAIGVLGWAAESPNIYLVEELINYGQGVTELADQIKYVLDKYEPLKIVIDTGGLGKKLAVELTNRYSLPVVAAEKSRKFEFIELLNDALRTGKFKAKSSSQFAQDCFLVEWDRSKAQKLIVKDSFHSDITDAVLYAYREALHWLYTPAVPKIDKHTPEWYKKIEAQMEQDAVNRLETEQEPKEGLPSSDEFDY
jgi:hypothetical protein